MIVVFGKGKVGNGVSHLLSLLDISYVLMDDQDLDDTILAQAETILVSPGIKQSHHIYHNYSQKIQSELQFLSGLLPSIGLKNATRIGITATNGKSTTTWVTYQVFKTMFPEKNVWITGNFDVPVSESLAQIIEQKKQEEEHIFVVECSSFMLFNLRDFHFDYSILLNIARDHLDWHKDFDEYQESKLTLLRHTKDAFFVPASSWSLLDELLSSRGTKVEEKFDLGPTKFVWFHNKINLSVVESLILHYCKKSGWDPHLAQSRFIEVVSWVQPLPHRLGLLREIDGIKIYDDGICTSAHSLAAALSSFEEKVILIAGGYDKGDEYSWLSPLFLSKVWYAVLIGQTAEKLTKVCWETETPYVVASSLEEAIKISLEQAKKLTLSKIVFSPWAASFDMFKNVYDRVDQFEKIVTML